MLDGVKGGCTCPHDPDKVYELLLCRVVLGGYRDRKIVYRSSFKDILKSPQLTNDKRRFDSVVYFKPDINGDYVVRVAIYDAGQVYPEYVVRYKRAYQQGQISQQQFNPQGQFNSQPQFAQQQFNSQINQQQSNPQGQPNQPQFYQQQPQPTYSNQSTTYPYNYSGQTRKSLDESMNGDGESEDRYDDQQQ